MLPRQPTSLPQRSPSATLPHLPRVRPIRRGRLAVKVLNLVIGTRGGGGAARPFPIVPLKIQTTAVACWNLPRSSHQGASVLRNNTSILRAAFSHRFSANEKTVLKKNLTESFIYGTRLRDVTRSETSSDNDGFPRFFSVPRLQFHEAPSQLSSGPILRHNDNASTRWLHL